MSKLMLTEDIVRDKMRVILGFDKVDLKKAKCGVGQLTSFNQLGFNGIKDRPDGWYLPNDKNEPAIILEAKSSTIDVKKYVEELQKNLKIVAKVYRKCIGIIFNGYEIIVCKDDTILTNENELKNYEYYLAMFDENKIDKNQIYNLTLKINEILHSEFGIKNLNHRMIFTACALVAKRYGASLIKGMNYATMHTSILSTLTKSFEDALKQNVKLELLTKVYAEIQMNITENQEAIDNFIVYISEVSDNLNSDYWNGEDVMAIFFNEFTRYKGKSEKGQVFTPDHITSLIYRITETNKDDIVLDACCGSGAFLVKAMCNMIKESGGTKTSKAKEIKKAQLYGIEVDREIFALACANMLIHKDGKTNLEQLDSRYEKASEWIKSKHITKVLMNPPFENRYGCLDIVSNVLDSVEKGAVCAFIMPDNKLETNKKLAARIKMKHRLMKIVKLPTEIFTGTTTSVFIYSAGEPQGNKEIFSCYIKEDGFETVKNQGRHDTKNKWQNIEDYWVDIIYKQSGDESIQWINPNGRLAYQLPEEPFQINETDFKKVILDYVLFENKIDEKLFKKSLIDNILYGSFIDSNYIKFSNLLKVKNNFKIDVSKWGKFDMLDLFNISGTKTTPKGELDLDNGGEFPYLTTQATNNAVYGYSKKWTEKGNVLVVDSAVLGTCTFQSKNFTASDHVEKLSPKFNMTKKIALFFVAVINKTGSYLGYSYSKKRSQIALKNEKIYLPITEKGEPDFDYMEKYISIYI